MKGQLLTWKAFIVSVPLVAVVYFAMNIHKPLVFPLRSEFHPTDLGRIVEELRLGFHQLKASGFNVFYGSVEGICFKREVFDSQVRVGLVLDVAGL